MRAGYLRAMATAERVREGGLPAAGWRWLREQMREAERAARSEGLWLTPEVRVKLANVLADEWRRTRALEIEQKAATAYLKPIGVQAQREYKHRPGALGSDYAWALEQSARDMAEGLKAAGDSLVQMDQALATLIARL